MSKVKEMVASINESNLRGFTIGSRNDLTTYSMVADIDGEEVEIFVLPTKSAVERSVIKERMSRIAEALSSSSTTSSLFSGYPGYGFSPSMYGFNSGTYPYGYNQFTREFDRSMYPHGYNPSKYPMNGEYAGDMGFKTPSDEPQDSFSKEDEEKKD